jgi:hypothetical protein
VNDNDALKREEVSMFVPVLESVGKIAGATVEMQQEMLKKWFALWPATPSFPGFPGFGGYPPAWAEQAQKVQKKWAEAVSELIRRRRETVESQFKVVQQNIEKAFQVGEAKTPEELRAKTIELWQKCFEAVRQASEAQLRDFQAAADKWFELMTTPLPTS